MAKRALKRPDVPAGARLAFFAFMQELVVENGDLPTKQLGELVNVGHQAVYKALTGPKVPSRHLTLDLARKLGGNDAALEALDLWQKAVKEQRGFDTGQRIEPSPASLANPVQPPKAQPDPARLKFAKVINAIVNSRRGGVRRAVEETPIPRSTLYSWTGGASVPGTRTFMEFYRAADLDQHERDDLLAAWLDARGESDSDTLHGLMAAALLKTEASELTFTMNRDAAKLHEMARGLSDTGGGDFLQAEN